jgi:hypothetical protein
MGAIGATVEIAADRSSIVLEFFPDPDAIRELREPERKTKAGGRRNPPPLCNRIQHLEFEYGHYLRMPVRLALNGVDLLRCSGFAHPRFAAIHGVDGTAFANGHSPCPWAWMPIAYLASRGLRKVEASARYGFAKFELPFTPSLAFRVDGTDICVTAESTSRTQCVAYDKLHAAWGDFENRVRTCLLAILPELAANQQIGPWLSGGSSFFL